MKSLFKILFSLLFAFSVSQAAAFEKDAKFRTTTVHISSQKPLSVGSNTLVLDLRLKGKISDGAKVSVKAFMPAMPGMPAMESKAEAKDFKNGKYEVNLNLAMSGTWQLHIFIKPIDGKKLRVKSSLNF